MQSDVSIKLKTFFQKYSSKDYKRREMVLQGGDTPSGLLYLTKGIVRQYAITAGGEELTINIFKSPSLFPMGWIVNDTISPHFFEAMTAVRVWVAPKKDALKFFKTEPDILMDLIQRIYRGLDGYFLRMEYLMRGSAQARLLAELLIYAKRFGELKENSVKVSFKLTERDLAAQAGIARETVSREVQKLKQKGLITFEKCQVPLSLHNVSKRAGLEISV